MPCRVASMHCGMTIPKTLIKTIHKYMHQNVQTGPAADLTHASSNDGPGLVASTSSLTPSLDKGSLLPANLWISGSHELDCQVLCCQRRADAAEQDGTGCSCCMLPCCSSHNLHSASYLMHVRYALVLQGEFACCCPGSSGAALRASSDHCESFHFDACLTLSVKEGKCLRTETISGPDVLYMPMNTAERAEGEAKPNRPHRSLSLSNAI